MKYSQIRQKSPKYKYGKRKEFKTKEEALEAAIKAEKNANTEIALIKMYKLSKSKIVKRFRAFQVVVTMEIPSVFELNNRNSK